MPKQIDPFWEGYITALSDANYSYSSIIKECKKRNFSISKHGINCVLNKIGKARKGLIPEGKKQANPRSSTSRTPDMVQKVSVLVSGPNPATQRDIAKKVGASQATINTIIKQDLKLKLERRKKSKVQKPLPCPPYQHLQAV